MFHVKQSVLSLAGYMWVRGSWSPSFAERAPSPQAGTPPDAHAGDHEPRTVARLPQQRGGTQKLTGSEDSV